MIIYTIGHSNHGQSRFLELLNETGVQVLVDTRSTPASSHAPFANLRNLARILPRAGIRYVYMGDTLGGRPANRDLYSEHAKRPDYARLQGQPEFQKGIQSLLEEAAKSTLCIMCSEEDPARCHRHLLIGDQLRQHQVKLLHIRGDGSIQDDRELPKSNAHVRRTQMSLPL